MKVNKFNATFVANGQTIQFRNIAMAKSKQYRQSEWSLTVKAGEFTGLRFAHTDGIKFDLKSVTYDIAFPLTNAAKIIVPDTGRHFMNTIYPRQVMFKDGGYLVSSAHMSTPFFVYLDGLEQVTLAFGLMGKTIDTRFIQTSPAANKKFSLVVYANECRWRIAKPYHEHSNLGSMKVWEDGFYQSAGDKTWFHALRTYATLWQKEHRVRLKTNRSIFKPELCTWRVVSSDRLTHDWTIRTARECRKMGIEAMILDDGWFGVGLDSDVMESSLGNWPRAVAGKYPDITRTIREMKQLGVAPLLW